MVWSNISSLNHQDTIAHLLLILLFHMSYIELELLAIQKLSLIPGNITATISDHLPQFSFVPNILSNPSIQNSNFMKEIGQNLNKKTYNLTTFIKIGLTYIIEIQSDKLLKRALSLSFYASIRQSTYQISQKCKIDLSSHHIKTVSKPILTDV